jgi:hypothetical protein
MSLSKAITGVTVKEDVRLTDAGTTQRVVLYRFKVGAHGPFTLTYEQGRDTPEKVSADMQAQVNKLVAIGVMQQEEV